MMGRVVYYVCDICGKKELYSRTYDWRWLRRFLFHYELAGGFICTECLEQLKVMREANMMLERKEE